jgi:prepilin-type N-terminal cleavage/methylation domain-containing protein
MCPSGFMNRRERTHPSPLIPREKLSRLGFISQERGKRAFTVVELLVVIAIGAILAALATPALSSLSRSGDMNQAVSGISLLLNESRAFAMAHNTYVWVGFSQNQATQMLTVGAVAGTTGQMDDLSTATYLPVIKPQIYNHFSLKALGGVPGMATNGDDIAESSIGAFQQTVAGNAVSFTEVIQFSPQGEATINPSGSTVHSIEIGLQPVLRSNDLNVAVFQVASLTGQVQVFRP